MPVYNRLRSIISDPSKRFHVFTNEHCKCVDHILAFIINSHQTVQEHIH